MLLPNPDLVLMMHREKLEKMEKMRRHLELPRRPWMLPKLRHLLFFW